MMLNWQDRVNVSQGIVKQGLLMREVLPADAGDAKIKKMVNEGIRKRDALIRERKRKESEALGSGGVDSSSKAGAPTNPESQPTVSIDNNVNLPAPARLVASFAATNDHSNPLAPVRPLAAKDTPYTEPDTIPSASSSFSPPSAPPPTPDQPYFAGPLPSTTFRRSGDWLDQLDPEEEERELAELRKREAEFQARLKADEEKARAELNRIKELASRKREEGSRVGEDGWGKPLVVGAIGGIDDKAAAAKVAARFLLPPSYGGMPGTMARVAEEVNAEPVEVEETPKFEIPTFSLNFDLSDIEAIEKDIANATFDRANDDAPLEMAPLDPEPLEQLMPLTRPDVVPSESSASTSTLPPVAAAPEKQLSVGLSTPASLAVSLPKQPSFVSTASLPQVQPSPASSQPPSEAGSVSSLPVTSQKHTHWIESSDLSIDLSQKLGSGGFADVHPGLYLSFTPVAVKLLRDVSTPLSQAAFTSETITSSR